MTNDGIIPALAVFFTYDMVYAYFNLIVHVDDIAKFSFHPFF